MTGCGAEPFWLPSGLLGASCMETCSSQLAAQRCQTCSHGRARLRWRPVLPVRTATASPTVAHGPDWGLRAGRARCILRRRDSAWACCDQWLLGCERMPPRHTAGVVHVISFQFNASSRLLEPSAERVFPKLHWLKSGVHAVPLAPMPFAAVRSAVDTSEHRPHVPLSTRSSSASS